ncbi:MAG: NADH-quinone oxidoreductase subunit L [Nakamurella sp.]
MIQALQVVTAAAPPAASGVTSLAPLVLLLPLIGAVVLMVGGRTVKRVAPLIGCLSVVVAFVLAISIFISTIGMDAASRVSEISLWSWMPVESLQVEFGMRIDPLSLTFMLLITGVGALIHIYSIGYMQHDENRQRFFAYMNLFVAAMLLLVMGNSFLATYAGWEGVGLASYLLIGFWSYKPSAGSAAKKSFVMNRVGDFGFVIGIFIMFTEMGTTSFTGVFANIGEVAKVHPGAVTVMSLCLLLGACAKSGQVPLQAWLPDAMEGPTPVSALIHAATMVTAGVYLITRSAEIYNLTDTGQLVVTIVGAVTIMVGAIAGCGKDDIKKVLAYSTVSQIGYMFLAAGLGTGVYGLAILHLLTHGFFKAGLFLASGSILHGMNEQVNMRHFGGLAKRMPLTFVTMTAGYLAIIGFPYFSGFFSKDPIIEAAFAVGGTKGWLLGMAAAIGAGLTAFYMTRLMIMTFFGDARWKNLKSPDGADYHPHESKSVMTVPMLILALGALFAGGILASGDRLVNWLAPSVGAYVEPHPTILTPGVITWGSVALMVIGAGIAYVLFGMRPVPVTQPVTRNPIILLARAGVGGDAINESLFARPGIWLARTFAYADARGVDGVVDGVGTSIVSISDWWKKWQNGYVRSYALSMLSGTLLIAVALMVVNFS